MPELKIDQIKTIEKKLAKNIGLLLRKTISSRDVLKNHICSTYSFIFKLCKHCTPITKLKPLLYKHKQAVRIAFKVLCYLQILKNTKFVRIILKSILQQLINPVLSSKK